MAGHFPRPSSPAATLDDVAREAGVSPMTVSRVINGATNVRPATRDKVRTAIAALRYIPNPAARHLAGARQLRIGLFYNNPSAAYLSELLVGCLEQAQHSAVQLILERGINGDALPGVRHMIEGGVDGVLLPSPLCDDEAIVKAFSSSGIPMVMIATGRPRDDTSAVLIDDMAAANTMTRHLIKLGHRRIGFITGAANQTASARRLLGYRQALKAARLESDDSLIAPGAFTYRSGLEAAELLLNRPDPPSAIFAANDDMAAGCIAVAHGRRLDVPGQLSVCGFDDTSLATSIWPELTTIRQPIASMAQSALRMLVQAIQDAPRAEVQHLVLDFSLISRQSAAKLRRLRRQSALEPAS